MTTTAAEQDTAAEVGDEGPRHGRRRRVLAIGVPTFAVALHASLYGKWIEDDAGITFAYARSVTSGFGLVLQPGVGPVEGYSNPLWLALLALGRVIGLFDRGAWFGVPDLVAFPKLLALICCAGVFACFYAVVRRTSTRPALLTAVAGTLTACVPSFIIWCFSGLENSLYALLVVGLATVLATTVLDGTVASERSATLCGLLAAAAVLTRPDGLIYTLAFPLVLVAVHRAQVRELAHVVVRYIAIVALPTLAYLVLRLAVFGDWLPNTARAKVQQLPSLMDLNRPVELVAYGGWLLVAIAGVAVVLTLAESASRARTAVWVLLVPLGLAVLAFAVLDADWMPQGRFATPVWPLAILVGVLAGAEESGRLGPRLRALGAAAVVAALIVSAAGWVDATVSMLSNPIAPICSIARVTGFMINSYADQLGIEEASLLGIDAGGTSLTTRLRFVDYAGLTDPVIGRFRQEGDGPGLRNYIFNVARPTFTRIGDAFTGEPESELLKDPRLLRDYVPIEPASSRLFVAVRRDAVRDPAKLAEVQAFARQAAVANQRNYAAGGGSLGWSCGPVLRPGPFTP